MRYAAVCLVVLGGCSALAPVGVDEDSTLEPAEAVAPPSMLMVPSSPFSAGSGGSSGLRGFDNPLTDPVLAASPPAPINGGTLLIARDGRTAIAADPDRDRVSLADLENLQVLATIELEAGDEPGRSAEDGAGRVHVVLRRRGEVASISLATRSLIERRPVCRVPQGIAYDAARDELLIACSEGDLVALPAGGGEVARRTFIAPDLRDVVLIGGKRYVSRFKSAELIELDGDGAVRARSTPGRINGPFLGLSGAPELGAAPNVKSFDAGVAWRTVGVADGRVLMLHQRAQATPIALALDDPHSGQAGAGGAAGSSSGAAGTGAFGGSNPYGGGTACDSIVRPALSANPTPGAPLLSGPVLPAATLVVDAAVSRDSRWVALAVAGRAAAPTRCSGRSARWCCRSTVGASRSRTTPAAARPRASTPTAA